MNHPPSADLPAMSAAEIDHVCDVERMLQAQPQIDLKMEHRVWADMYSRMVLLPAGLSMTGVPVKIATQVTIIGTCKVWMGAWKHIVGPTTLIAEAGRKQMFEAITDTYILMAFGTKARTLSEAEEEFTDAPETLASRRPGALNDTIITGEQTCPV